MQRVAIERADTERVWVRSRESEKFLENGLWGLRDIKGKVILEPKYDQIELCKELYMYTQATAIPFTIPTVRYPLLMTTSMITVFMRMVRSV